MSDYEKRAWVDLEGYWQRKAERREMPPPAAKAVAATKANAQRAASATGGALSKVTPQAVKNAGGFVIDQALEPTVNAVLGIIDGVTETVQELVDPKSVLAHHQSRGRDVDQIKDLRDLDLEHLDAYTRTLTLWSRGTGLVEGAAMGLLTFVPVAGSVAAIGADIVVMHALSTGIATRAAYAYGIDPTSEAERHHLDRVLEKVWAAQAPKATTVNSARNAFNAGAGRTRWSAKFRKDHRIAVAVEKLLKQVGNVQHVPIDKVVAKLPYIGLVTSAGINSAVLGSIAKNSIRYSQTIHLSDKYGLPLPQNLTDPSV